MPCQTQTTRSSRPTSFSSANTQPASDWTAAGFTLVDDEDITFDGQPLSALYEMTRYRYVHVQWKQQQQREERGRKRDR
jgi:hypothetical protein